MVRALIIIGIPPDWDRNFCGLRLGRHYLESLLAHLFESVHAKLADMLISTRNFHYIFVLRSIDTAVRAVSTLFRRENIKIP